MIKKQWLVRPEDKTIEELQKALNISYITAKVMANRGIDTITKGKEFLYSGYQDLHSPWELPDMKISVERIIKALSTHENITVYGDYDVDGQTGTALLVRVLRRLADDPNRINYYIPHRMDEGYGLHKDALTKIAKNSSLVITVDCGISAISEAKYTQKLGLDLIITDHHEPALELPVAVGVINPKRSDSNYPFPELAGVGVAYKLVQALGQYYQQDFQEFLDLVALGTVADLVPLVDENRILTKLGLEKLATSSCIGLKSLIQVCELKKPYDAADLGYRLGPRLNAVGRMGEPSRGITLLLTEDAGEAKHLAHVLDKENRFRQGIELEIFTEAKAIIEAEKWEHDAVIVVAQNNWHPGVIGIVASRLVETYYRPTIVVALEDGIGKASARSIAGFNLYEGLNNCQELLESFGGHEMAAGLTIKEENIPFLRERLAVLVDEALEPDDFVPKLLLDAKVSFAELNHKLLKEFSLLEPFGVKNPTPILQVCGSVQEVRAIGDGTHFSCQIQDETGNVKRAVGFGMYKKIQELQGYYEQMEFAVWPQPGYRDTTVIELLLRDIQPVVNGESFVEDWITQYPWDLPSCYEEISLFKTDPIRQLPIKSTKQPSCWVKDGRNVWDKMKLLLKELDVEQTALIYVATAEQALSLCRQLRIAVPGNPSFIGFEHEYISEKEKLELKELVSEGRLKWIVSTGLWAAPQLWDQIVYYSVPVVPELPDFLTSNIVEKGKVLALYGKADCDWYQAQIKRAFPARNLLARFYLAMIKINSQEVSQAQLEKIAANLSLNSSLSFILGVFTELNLIKPTGQGIKILPKPAERLDLCSSLLYNEAMKKCELYLAYSRHCLERGFLDEFNRKDKDYRRFS